MGRETKKEPIEKEEQMTRITPLETGILMFTLLIVCGVGILILFGTTTTTVYIGSPSQDEIKERAEIQAKWDEMITAIQEEDEAKVEELGRWLDQHAGTTFEKLEDAKAKLICAWCGEVIGEANTSEDTHGICESCKTLYFPPE